MHSQSGVLVLVASLGETAGAGAGAVVVAGAGVTVDAAGAGEVVPAEAVGAAGVERGSAELVVPFGQMIIGLRHGVEHGIHHVLGESFPVELEVAESEVWEVPGVDLGKDSADGTIPVSITPATTRSAIRRDGLTAHSIPRFRLAQSR